jgi:1-acyl-sn-glycerol-3-phosphate acyltransferase
LFNRHWQHYKPDPGGWNWLEYGLFLVPGGFYLAIALRGLRRMVRSRFAHGSDAGQSAPPVEAIALPPDPAYQQAFRAEILTPLVTRYFRAELLQHHHLPATGPAIIAINHAGMCFPWDFLCLGWLLSQERDWFVQPLAHPLFFDHLWLKWWLPEGWAQAMGGVRAERDSFAAAIADNTVLLYAPEGWRGLAKGWWQRYQLARFDSSFVQLSVRHRVPVVPILCIGSESLHPFAINVKWLARLFKMPMFPLSPLLPLFILFPSMGIWAMRSHLTYHIQPSWRPWEDIPSDHDHPPRQTVLHRLASELRSRLQLQLNHLSGPEKPGQS